jgi:hypothetical protein
MMWYSYDPGTKSLVLPAHGKLFRAPLSLTIDFWIAVECSHSLLCSLLSL